MHDLIGRQATLMWNIYDKFWNRKRNCWIEDQLTR